MFAYVLFCTRLMNLSIGCEHRAPVRAEGNRKADVQLDGSILSKQEHDTDDIISK